MPETLESTIATHERDGFVQVEAAPRDPSLRPGARVHNRGEQFHEAFINGTATVLAVLRRGTDERPDSWERKYGRPNVEVVVRHDRDGDIRCWADYVTDLAHEQPEGVSS